MSNNRKNYNPTRVIYSEEEPEEFEENFEEPDYYEYSPQPQKKTKSNLHNQYENVQPSTSKSTREEPAKKASKSSEESDISEIQKSLEEYNAVPPMVFLAKHDTHVKYNTHGQLQVTISYTRFFNKNNYTMERKPGVNSTLCKQVLTILANNRGNKIAYRGKTFNQQSPWQIRFFDRQNSMLMISFPNINHMITFLVNLINYHLYSKANKNGSYDEELERAEKYLLDYVMNNIENVYSDDRGISANEVISRIVDANSLSFIAYFDNKSKTGPLNFLSILFELGTKQNLSILSDTVLLYEDQLIEDDVIQHYYDEARELQSLEEDAIYMTENSDTDIQESLNNLFSSRTRNLDDIREGLRKGFGLYKKIKQDLNYVRRTINH